MISSKNNILLFLILISYFLPYIYMNKFRIDHLVSIFFLIYFIIYIYFNKLDKIFFFISILSISFFIIISIRFLFTDNLLKSLQIINQYSYILSGIGIYFYFKGKISHINLIKYLYFCSILIYLYAYFQIYFNDINFISFINNLYETERFEHPIYGAFNSKTAEILSGGQAISVFTGMQGLAIYCLFIFSVSLGSLKDEAMKEYKIFSTVILIWSIYTGFLTGSKTFTFGLIIFLILIFLYKPTIKSIFLIILSSLLLLFTSIYSYQNNDILNIIMNGNFYNIFSSRFGSSGYLTDVMDITYQIDTILFGLGIDALNFKYADNQFRQVLIAGGLVFFIFYYATLILFTYIIYKKNKYNSYSINLFFLSIIFLIAGIGMDIHFQARVIVIFVFTSLFLSQIPLIKYIR